jgi:hypothetical protein
MLDNFRIMHLTTYVRCIVSEWVTHMHRTSVNLLYLYCYLKI